MECSLRYNGSIQRVYTDGGRNLLQANLFGENSNIAVKNNIPYSQFRNVSESATRGVKTLIAQLGKGKTLGIFELRYIFDVISAEHNATPFLEENNSVLCAPIDGIIAPVGVQRGKDDLWKGSAQMESVRKLSRLGEMYGESVRVAIIEDFISNSNLWRSKRFPGRNAVEVEVGDICRIKYNNEIGAIAKIGPQLVEMQLRGADSTVTIHKHNLEVLVAKRLGMEKVIDCNEVKKNVFLSVELSEEGKEFVDSMVEKLKKDLSKEVKYRSRNSLHITLGALELRDEKKTKEIVKRIDEVLSNLRGTDGDPRGFLVGLGCIESWIDENLGTNILVINLDRRHPTVHCVRDALTDSLGSEIEEEKKFCPHVTIGTNVEVSESNNAAINSLNLCKRMVQIPAFVCSKIELRIMKKEVKMMREGSESLLGFDWFKRQFPTYQEGSGVLQAWSL